MNEHPFSLKKAGLSFLLLTLALCVGIALALLQAFLLRPGLSAYDAAGLRDYYTYHVMFLIPHLAGVFFRLFLSNAGVALFILLVPLYWAGILWFRRDLLGPVTLCMKGTVILLMIALGHNSFSRLYLALMTLPPDVVATMYYPHGIPEMLAFLLAGTGSLLAIDATRSWLEEAASGTGLHPGEVVLFVLGRTYRIFLFVLVLLVLAAAIECWVTPGMVKAALESALAAYG